MNPFEHASSVPSSARTRVLAIAAIIVLAFVVFAATGGWSDFIDGFADGVHSATAPTIPAAPR